MKKNTSLFQSLVHKHPKNNNKTIIKHQKKLMLLLGTPNMQSMMFTLFLIHDATIYNSICSSWDLFPAYPLDGFKRYNKRKNQNGR